MLHFVPLVLALFLAWSPLPALSETSLNNFTGHWHGTDDFNSEGFDIAAVGLEIQLSTTDRGFKLRWNVPGGHKIDDLFAPTEKPGVFSASPQKGGFRDLFSSSKETDPLAGDALLWARIDADSLIIYSLTIDKHGAYLLDSTQLVSQQDSLLLYFRRLAHGTTERSLTTRLQRGGNR